MVKLIPTFSVSLQGRVLYKSKSTNALEDKEVPGLARIEKERRSFTNRMRFAVIFSSLAFTALQECQTVLRRCSGKDTSFLLRQTTLIIHSFEPVGTYLSVGCVFRYTFWSGLLFWGQSHIISLLPYFYIVLHPYTLLLPLLSLFGNVKSVGRDRNVVLQVLTS